ncbi:MAG TPA: hypothetical protein VIQ00_02990 [Chitinophagaceae bacterium]|jgi:hypothetical protein
MDKKSSHKTISDYPRSEKNIDMAKADRNANEESLRNEKRLAADLEDKRPAGDTGPEDDLNENEPTEFPPY